MNSEIDAKLTKCDALQLERIVSASPILQPLLMLWTMISLPDYWLVAGAIAQTVWNHSFGFAPNHGLSNIDLIYFDGEDLSEESEAKHANRIRQQFSGLGIKIDVKNEARIHLWYFQKFGYEITPYTSARHAITTFPTTATAVGIRPDHSGLLISAPFGLSDLLASTVRPNTIQITREIYESKVRRWRSLWPRLRIIAWPDDTSVR